MKFRTRLFIIWSCVVLLLWAGAGWSVRNAIQSSFDRVAAEGFAGARRDLHRQQAERVHAMRQAAAMVMSIPELRALIAEHNFEVSSENLASLQERLDNLAGIVGVNFVCVLDARGNVIAQNHDSPWKTLAALNTFLKDSPPGAAMVDAVFRGAAGMNRKATADALGLWSYQNRLFQGVGVPLVFDSNSDGSSVADGGLIMAAPFTDTLAADLAQSHNCQVTFLTDGTLAACSLPPELKWELQSAYRRSHWPASNSFDVTMGGVSFRSSMETLSDPCSGQAVGAMLIQSDLKDARNAHASVSKRLILSMAGGLIAAALASFFVSSAVTRPVRELSRGVQRLADGDLDVNIRVPGKDELGVLAATFNDMVRQLRARRELERMVEESRATSAAKSQFLANMSHEIRTPLNGVVGMAELLLRTRLDDRQQKYAGLVKSSAEVLTTLINDILDFSKIEAGKLELESLTFDLHELTEEVVELLALKAQAKGLQVICDLRPGAPQWVQGDPMRVRQVIVNLINNAVKFTEAGEVVVSVAAEATGGGSPRIRMEVGDTGIGIPSERMDRLFQSFSQVDASTTRRFGGTGLGLAICKQLIELMGGTIGAKSEAGSGSTFWFVVPLEPRHRDDADADSLARQSAGALRGVSVLVVDANETYRHVLCQSLVSLGCMPVAAASAQEAADALRSAAAQAAPFRVVILDQATTHGGDELPRQIQERQEQKNLSVLLLVPLGSEPDSDERSHRHVAGYVTKPVRRRQLRDALLSAVGVLSPQSSHPNGEASTGAQTPESCVACRGRVLIAEDNEINQMVAADLLRGAGYTCHVVADGQAAVAAFERGGYDLILMDCQMPLMDGFAATREIRTRESSGAAAGRKAPHIAIIALTANAGGGEREKCTAAGMDSYVAKPFNVEQLLQTVHSLLPAGREQSMGEQPAGEQSTGDSQVSPNSTGPGLPPVNVPAANSSKAEVACIDLDGMLKRCSGNTKLAISILQKFEMQASEVVEKLKRNLDGNEFEEIARTAHRLKGTAGILAAGELIAAAARVEELGQSRSSPSLADEVARLNQAVLEVANCAAITRVTLAAGAPVAAANNKKVAG